MQCTLRVTAYLYILLRSRRSDNFPPIFFHRSRVGAILFARLSSLFSTSLLDSVQNHLRLCIITYHLLLNFRYTSINRYIISPHIFRSFSKRTTSKSCKCCSICCEQTATIQRSGRDRFVSSYHYF